MPAPKSRFGVFALLAILIGPTAAVAADAIVADTPEAAAADPDFLLQGEYKGTNVGFQIVALGGGEFSIVKLPGGLPGAGWTGKDRQVADGDSEDVRDLIESQKLMRVERKSPTLEMKPPADAVVLFDGTQGSLDAHWQPGAKMTPDGLLIQGVTSKDTFTDYSLHVEFRLPYMPAARGQGRGNSGVYYQGRYETQVLDSFGLEGKDNECGGLYSIRDPDLNMCLPPLAWQTYDAEFTAARWDAAGKKIANAKLTVRLNGVVVHQDVEGPKITTAAPVAESPSPGPVYIQDHGNPVRFRNIWAVPRNAEREALRPIVPAFERFFAGQEVAAGEGGALLAGELGCLNCHAAEGTTSRPGPKLDGVGRRAKAAWLAKFIESPHAVKPGTTMPEMFEGLSDEQRRHETRALVSFLASSMEPQERGGDRAAAKRGAKLFREVGCVACHEPRGGEGSEAVTVNRSATIPLPNLAEKYTIPSLAEFLKNPHEVRTSGRMPSFGFDDREVLELASFLIGDPTTLSEPNVQFAAYHGSWELVPDFDALEGKESGLARGFDVSVAERENNFAVRFDGYWKIEKTGQYRFFLGSDDGSKMWIDDVEVVGNDGVHALQENIGRAQLTAGVHHVRVGYFQGGGDATLKVEIDGGGFARQPLEALLRPTAEAAERPPEPVKSADPDAFSVDVALRDEGKALFQSRGCAGCHQFTEDGQKLASTRAAKPWRELTEAKGCLATPSAGTAAVLSQPAAPQFELNGAQRLALVAAMKSTDQHKPLQGQRLIANAMASFNCYACHKQNGRGGPERDRDPLFVTTIQEMGDEGRIPPPLDGVGDKLRSDWLKHVLQDGTKDRRYMKTQMPKFGSLPVDDLVHAFVEMEGFDSGVKPPELSEPPHRVIATGRKLAGNGGMACVKCHNFGRYPATGIQAINLQTMTRRIREDWFYRYLVDPQKYRPGTRMPTAFVDGVSAVRDIYDGQPDRQMAALWAWLAEGDKAGVPDGVLGETIELTPTDSPILYRNFLEGLSPRGIAVGYPEKAHLAWDAEKMCLALVWHGRFIDAGMHWNGRGSGNQTPLGDHVMRIESTVPLALLDSRDAAWPEKSPRESGYVFRGYNLDSKQRPAFRYDLMKPSTDVDRVSAPLAHVTDFLEPAVDFGPSGEPGFRRSLVITADSQVDNLYFRAASGMIEASPADLDLFVVDGQWRVRVKTNPPSQTFIRKVGGKQELIVPLKFEDGRVEVNEEIAW
jgi:mono/diheme cytochrome c family protein